MGRKRTTSDTWKPIHADRLTKDKYIRDTQSKSNIKPIDGNIKPIGRYVIDLTDKLPDGQRMPGRCRKAATRKEAEQIRAELVARFNALALEILNRPDDSLAAVAIKPGRAAAARPSLGPCPTFAEAVTNSDMLDAWLIDIGKSKSQRSPIIRELKGKPSEILGEYRLDQIGHAEWDLFRTTLLNTRTRHGIRKQMDVEDALKYKAEQRRLKRQAKEPEGGARYIHRPRKGAEIECGETMLPFISADRVKRLKMYVHNLFRAAVNKGHLDSDPWAKIQYTPNKAEDLERTGRRHFDVEDEENPSDVKLVRNEVRAFCAKGETVERRLAILQAVFGVRIGEAMGAPWGQLQQVNGIWILHVTHQIRMEDNRPVRTGKLKTPKSKRSIPALPIDSDLIELLGARGDDHEFICTAGTKLPDPGDIHERYLVALMKAGLTHRFDRPDATPHAFRSYAISRWMNEEVMFDGSRMEPQDVMIQAGHSRLDTTMRFYVRTEMADFTSRMIEKLTGQKV